MSKGTPVAVIVMREEIQNGLHENVGTSLKARVYLPGDFEPAVIMILTGGLRASFMSTDLGDLRVMMTQCI
jgi:hypothetical protein